MNDLKKYNLCRDRIKTGDCIEFRTNSIVGWLIRKVTGKEETHTAKVIRFDLIDPDRIYLLEALDHGIELNLLSERLKKQNGNAWWVPLMPEFDNKRLLLGMYSLRWVGTPYDYFSIFKQLFNKVKINAKRFFCSEFANAVDIKAGLPVKKMKYAPRPGEMVDTGIYLDSIKIL
jgi:hypothetical protein